jgi:hypothetical protein
MMHSEEVFMLSQEYEAPERTFEAICIAPNGVGFGEGSISADRANDPEYPVSKEDLTKAVEILIRHRDEIIVPVDEDDDGCGDGRGTERVFQIIDGTTGEKHEYKKSKKRAKIFGGGLQVVASMRRAIKGAPANGETVLSDRKFMAGELKKRGIKYGAHTDSHAHGPNCGCGAIDKYEQTTAMSGKYRTNITPLVGMLYDDESVNTGVDQAFGTRATISQDKQYMSNASGHDTMEFIKSDGAVVKELGGKHLEMIDYINDEPGTTVDQPRVAELFREAGLPEGIDVFVVDAWRGQMYADVAADITAEEAKESGEEFDRDTARNIALADFYINQLSVSATLTKGDQPVIHNRLTTPQ